MALLNNSCRWATCGISLWNLCSYEAAQQPIALDVPKSLGNKAFREGTTEPHKSPMYPHESFKMQFWITWAQILCVKRRSWPRRVVSFTRKDTGKDGSGVIAQELQKIAPELINKDEINNTLGVAYGNLTGYLIEAIKELKAEIEELKKQIK